MLFVNKDMLFVNKDMLFINTELFHPSPKREGLLGYYCSGLIKVIDSPSGLSELTWYRLPRQLYIDHSAYLPSPSALYSELARQLIFVFDC